MGARGLVVVLPNGGPLTLSRADIALHEGSATAQNGKKLEAGVAEDGVVAERTFHARGTFHAEGEDASRLLELLKMGGAVPWLFPQLAGAPFTLNGEFAMGAQGLRLSALRARADQVNVRGELVWSPRAFSGAILLSAAQTRVGLVLAEGKVEVVLSPKSSWLQEQLALSNHELSSNRETGR